MTIEFITVTQGASAHADARKVLINTATVTSVTPNKDEPGGCWIYTNQRTSPSSTSFVNYRVEEPLDDVATMLNAFNLE